jgi:hypothetical protein
VPRLFLFLLLSLLLTFQQGTGRVYPVQRFLYEELDQSQLRNGDIIFRQGISMVSRLVQGLDNSVPYTHVGLIVSSPEGFLVVHAVPAEDNEVVARVKKESLEDFLRPDRARALGIYRSECDAGELARISQWAIGKADSQTPFDDSFDLSDTNSLYCTELIWRAFLCCSVDLCQGSFDYLPFARGRKQCILPGRISHSKHLNAILYLPTKTKQNENNART